MHVRWNLQRNPQSCANKEVTNDHQFFFGINFPLEMGPHLMISFFKKNSWKLKLDLVVTVWLVVSTHLKNICQNGSFPQIGMKIENN